jgi:hypothetical protein
MAKSIQIDQICSYLKGLTSTIGTVVSSRVYFWEPMREQTWVYIVVNSISQVVDRVSKQALVEFRLVWHDENDSKKSLVDLANILTASLVTTDDIQKYAFGSFSVYKVVEWWDFRIFIDEKNRNLLIKDYIFYFLD